MALALLIIVLVLGAVVSFGILSAKADYLSKQKEIKATTLLMAIFFMSPDEEINLPWYAFPLAILAGLGIYLFLVLVF